MGAPKPTLGYPSRTASILGMREQGVPAAEICRRIGIPLKTLKALEHSAARAKGPVTLKRRPRGDLEEQGRWVLFPADVLEALRPQALARDITPAELALRIVEAALEDGIVTAVLDDERPPE